MDFAALRELWLDGEIAYRYFRADDKKMLELQADADAEVERWLADLNRTPDVGTISLWEDLQSQPQEYRFWQSLRRLAAVAKQYSNPNSRFHKDAEALESIDAAMNWLYTNWYNPDKSIEGNWWCYEIGAPIELNNILVFLYDHFTSVDILRWTDVILRFVPDARYMMYTVLDPHIRAKGGNQSDIAKVSMLCGILREDEAMVQRAIDALASVFVTVSEGNGFYADDSYVDHGDVAYSGAYGVVLLEGLSELLPLVHACSYPLPKEALTMMVRWIREGYLPLVYRGEMMDMVRGRSMTRKAWGPHHVGLRLLSYVMRIVALAGLPGEDSVELRTLVKAHLQDEEYLKFTEVCTNFRDVALYNQLMGDGNVVSQVPVSFCKMYSSMAKFVAHNAEYGFGLGISMCSPTIKNYEFMNTENKRGWYVSDGCVSYFNGDAGSFSGNYQATVDPCRRPGITVLAEPREDGSGQARMENTFVGGFTKDQAAVVAMDFHNWDKSLLAKKAWFYLEDKLMCMVTGVQTNKSRVAVETILENRKMQEGSFRVSVDGREVVLRPGVEMIFHDAAKLFVDTGDRKTSFGFELFQSRNLHVLVEKRTAIWKDINDWEDETPVEDCYLTIWEEHTVEQDAFAYLLYPNRSVEGFEAELAEDSIGILQKDGMLQAVVDRKKELLMTVKYDSEPFCPNYLAHLENSICFVEPGMYCLTRKDEAFEVDYHDPRELFV